MKQVNLRIYQMILPLLLGLFLSLGAFAQQVSHQTSFVTEYSTLLRKRKEPAHAGSFPVCILYCHPLTE